MDMPSIYEVTTLDMSIWQCFMYLVVLPSSFLQFEIIALLLVKMKNKKSYTVTHDLLTTQLKISWS